MANLASALKEEIGRVARKEIRQQTAGTAKATAQIARDIAALKRQIQDLQSKLSSPRPQDAPGKTTVKKPTRKKAAAKPKGTKAETKAAAAAPAPAAPAAPAKRSARTRFSPKGLKADRERLGLSADNYGKLVGVSGLSIYNWEQGKARPRESSIASLMAIRGVGKREAAKRLGAVEKPKKGEKQAAASKQSANAADTKKDAKKES